MTREKYLIVNSIVSAIKAASTCYQTDGTEGEYSEEELQEIGTEIKKQCSKMKIDDLATILVAYCLPSEEKVDI
jgi:hypothetical protein